MILDLIPNSLVNQLINRYEKYSIDLIQDSVYVSEKNRLLSKKFVKLLDFQMFIEKTKSSDFTYFIIINNFFQMMKYRLMYPKASENVLYDVKFKAMLYIKFNSFTDSIVEKICKFIHDTDKRQLILDLRNNVGGNVDSCLKLLDKIIPKNKVLSIQYKDEKKDFYTDDDFVLFDNIYVLIGEQTASCSEILSMIIKKKINKSWLIGHKQDYKLCTQHVISNKLFRYRFAIADGIWTVEEEDASCLRNYIIRCSDTENSLDAYLKLVLAISNSNH